MRPLVAAQHATSPVMGEEAAMPPNLIAADLSVTDRWDAVSTPSPPNCSRRWEIVAAGRSSYDDDDLSIFHPSRHEGLYLQIELRRELISVCGDNPSRPPIPVEEEWLHRWRRRLLLHVKFWIESGKEFINSKLQSLREGGGGGGGPVWSFAALAGLLGFFIYLRCRHRRKKAALLFLLQEKDQRITLLLQQIAWMNEIIATRHGVPVPVPRT